MFLATCHVLVSGHQPKLTVNQNSPGAKVSNCNTLTILLAQISLESPFFLSFHFMPIFSQFQLELKTKYFKYTKSP